MPTRRRVLLGVAGPGGALVVGYALWPNGRIGRIDKLDAKPGERFVTNWIKIANDDTITVVIPHCDMGTGTFTSLSQMAADELDADWTKVRVEQAPSDIDFTNGAMVQGFALNGAIVPPFLRGMAANAFRFMAANIDIPGAGYVPQITGGSAAVRFTGMLAMRVTGAAARHVLIEAAAARWNVSGPMTLPRAKSGRVIHTASGRSLRYGELAAEATNYDPPSNPTLKDKSKFAIIGRPVQRFDIPRKVNGTTNYGLDVKQPGMLYAAIRISPVFGAKLKSVDTKVLQGRRGIKPDRQARRRRGGDRGPLLAREGRHCRSRSAILRRREREGVVGLHRCTPKGRVAP